MEISNNNQGMATLSEAAQEFKINEATLRKWVRLGKIASRITEVRCPACGAGRPAQITVQKEDVKKYLAHYRAVKGLK